MTAIPPPRYRIVERDRRLEVIDTRGAAPDKRATRLPALPLPKPRRTGFDGRAELTTHPFYDDNGPRTMMLDPGSAAMIGHAKLAAIVAVMAVVIVAIWMPWLIALPFALLADGVRKPVRAGITRWLDVVQRENS